MSLAHVFRLSFYISLAMSCVCLFYSEWDFIPWMTALLPFVLALVYMAYRREGRDYLSEQMANRLGTFIGVGTLLWIAFKAPRSGQEFAGGVPWPAALVPLLAPLLPILLMVKLFRPKKLSDFWVFQTISLVIVTLSCILAGEALYFLLLIIYLASQLWCLGLFFLYRHMVLGVGQAAQDGKQIALFSTWQNENPTPVPRQCVRPGRVLGWSMMVLSAGLAFFLVLPRFTDSPWVPSKLSTPGRTIIKTGIDPNLGMDLFREGIVEMSKDMAFHVEARDKDGRPANLPITQHWRVQILDEYDRGKWLNWRTSLDPRTVNARKSRNDDDHLVNGKPFPETAPPGMTDQQTFLVFQVTFRQAGGLPLADPIDNPNDVGLFPQMADVAADKKYAIFKFIEESDTFMTTSTVSQKHPDREVKFGQRLVPKFQGKEVPALPAASPEVREAHDRYINHLLSQEVPGPIQTWTRALVGRLPDLDENDQPAEDGHVNPARHARVARALNRYLSESGDFSYTLRLNPIGRNMDPTAEFLLKVKEGHCRRFASGLALMLRGLRIPSRIVEGYNGCQPTDKGRYLIQKDQAHSWVEALVPGRDGTMVWLQLDPTPSVAAASDSVVPFFKWAWTRLTNPEFTWKSLVMDYNTDRQTEVGDQFRQLWGSVSSATSNRSNWQMVWGLIRWPVLSFLGLIGALTGFSLWRRGLFTARRSPAAPPVVGFYDRLLKVLERCCQIRPQLGQTPLEFAAIAQLSLAARLSDEALTRLPARAVGVLYEQRFGGESPTPEISLALDAEVARLEVAFSAASPK